MVPSDLVAGGALEFNEPPLDRKAGTLSFPQRATAGGSLLKGHPLCLPATFRWEQRIAIMQFALPPRKTSHPPPYARPVRLPTDRRRQQLLGGLLVFTVLTLYLLVSWIRSPGNYRDHAPAGSPDVVIVTVFDTASMSEEYISKIKENREDYAQRHGSHP